MLRASCILLLSLLVVAPTSIISTGSPSVSPALSSSSCSDAASALTGCFQTNILACASCVEIALNLSSTTTAPASCQDANTMACPLYTCCPECSSETVGVFDCLTGSESSLTNCVFNCGGSNTTAPSVAPAAVTPTTITPTASTPTTIAPTASTPTASTPTASTPTAITPTAPTNTLASCSNATSTLKHCVEVNLFFCAACIPLGLNLSRTTTAPPDCQAANNMACPLYNCCPRCSSEVEAVFDCLIDGAASFSDCTFNCGGSDSTGTNSTTSAAMPISTKSWGLSLVITSVAAIFTTVIH